MPRPEDQQKSMIFNEIIICSAVADAAVWLCECAVCREAWNTIQKSWMKIE